MKKRIVCLANSWKNHGRCVAGVDLDTGKWIRPVNPGGAKLYKSQIKNQFGNQPQVLDIINIPLKEKEPLYYQPENYIIDSESEWQLEGRYEFDRLADLSCSGNDICIECNFFDENSDSIFTDNFMFLECKDSLSLIKPKELKIKKRKRTKYGPQIRGEFLFGDKNYDLAVTDDKFKSPFYGRNSRLNEYGYYKLDTDEIYLTISLGEELNEKHYKLVAAVIVDGDYNFRKL